MIDDQKMDIFCVAWLLSGLLHWDVISGLLTISPYVETKMGIRTPFLRRHNAVAKKKDVPLEMRTVIAESIGYYTALLT